MPKHGWRSSSTNQPTNLQAQTLEEMAHAALHITNSVAVIALAVGKDESSASTVISTKVPPHLMPAVLDSLQQVAELLTDELAAWADSKEAQA